MYQVHAGAQRRNLAMGLSRFAARVDIAEGQTRLVANVAYARGLPGRRFGFFLSTQIFRLINMQAQKTYRGGCRGVAALGACVLACLLACVLACVLAWEVSDRYLGGENQ